MALHLYTGHWIRVLEVICSPLQGVEKGKLQIITFSGFDEHTTPLLHVRLLNILKLADQVPFLHCLIYLQLSHWSFAMLFWYFLQTGIWSSWLLPVIIPEVQQNNLITYLNQEQIMTFLIFIFKDQKFGIDLTKILT